MAKSYVKYCNYRICKLSKYNSMAYKDSDNDVSTIQTKAE